MHEKITQYLIDNNIPTRCKGTKEKSYVVAILEGYEAAGMTRQSFHSFTKKYFPDKPKNISLRSYLLEEDKTFEPKSELERLIKKYFEDNSIPLFAGKNLQYNIVQGICNNNLSVRILQEITKTYFSDKPNAVHLRRWVPKLVGLRVCCQCEEIGAEEDFGKDSSTSDGISARCKSCSYMAVIDYNKANSAKRHAAKLNRTPKWVDQKAISEIYQNCPPGHDVDHIIPLQGRNVSGLHVPANLQYLTCTENRSKGNKFIVE